MKKCGNCGVTLDDSASFCTNCGAQFTATQPAFPQAPAKEPVSVGGWIGRSLIPCIPLVGGIVYLIMLFVWSGNTKKEDSFRNWAKAQLIVMAVVIVLTILLAVVFGTTLSAALESLM